MLQRKMSVAVTYKAASAVCTWLTAAGLLAACGQKGPLTLPTPIAAPPAFAAPASSPASSP